MVSLLGPNGQMANHVSGLGAHKSHRAPLACESPSVLKLYALKSDDLIETLGGKRPLNTNIEVARDQVPGRFFPA